MLWTILVVLVTIPLGLVLIVGFGLRFKPARFASYPGTTPTLSTVAIPDDLPAPVDRYLRTVAGGDEIPLTESAVLTGPARLRFGGITFNSRARFIESGGHGYRHYIELTLFGQPVLQANEIMLDGTSRMELPFGVQEGVEIDQAANLSAWGEQAAWMPSVLLTDPRVRWEPVDDTAARLIVPFKTGEDEFLVKFDPETGLLRSMEAMRFKEKGGEKVLWTIYIVSWARFHGLLLPSAITLTWADEGSSWATFTIDEVVYNVVYPRQRAVKGTPLHLGDWP